MVPINFKVANRTLSKPDNMTDKECGELKVFCDGNECISCWHMSIKERLASFFTGRVWVGVFSGNTQPPIRVFGEYPFKVERQGNHG